MTLILGAAVGFAVLAATQTGYAPLLWIECLVLPSAFLFMLALAVVSLPETRRVMRGQLSSASARWQFTLSELLVLTGGISALLAVAKQFMVGDLEIAPMLLIAAGSQTGVLFAALAAHATRRRGLWLGGAAFACLAVGIVVQSYMSAHWFWLLLGKLGSASPAELWEDLLSIPLTMLLTSSLAAATMLAAPARSGPPPPDCCSAEHSAPSPGAAIQSQEITLNRSE